jgi:hypothetical protein
MMLKSDRSLISDNGCTQLADALTNNMTLQSIDLYYNDITPLGATALSRYWFFWCNILGISDAVDPGCFAQIRP